MFFEKVKGNLLEVLINTILVCLFLGFIWLVIYLNSEYYIYEKLNIIYIIMFLLTIIKFFYDNQIEKIRLKRLEKKEILKKYDFEYYRNILKENSPVILSYVYNRKINNKKDLMACLLYLENEGYITITERIEYTGKPYNLLPQSLRYIIMRRKYIFDNNREYLNNLKYKREMDPGDYINNGRKKKLIKMLPITLYDKNRKQYTAHEMYYEEMINEESVYIVFVYNNEKYNYVGVYTDLEKQNEYNNDFFIAWNETCEYELKNKHYFKERTKFVFSISTLVLILILFALPFFAYDNESLASIYFFVSFGLISALIASKFIAEDNNKYIMTQKGYELYCKLNGLKKFISNFSMLEDKGLSQIKLWDEYLIYAIILNDSNNLVDETIERIKRLYNREHI